MRIFYTLLCISLSVPLCMQAQGIRIGVLGGTSIANGYGKGKLPGLENFSSAWGGISVEWERNDHLSIYTSLNYQRKGWKEAYLGTIRRDYHFVQSYGYLTLPIQAQYSWGEKLRASIRLGTYVGYFMYRDASIQPIRTLNFSIGPNPNSPLVGPRAEPGYSEIIPERWDWGLAAGAGLELEILPQLYAGLQGNFQLGLKAIGRDLIGRPIAMNHIFGDVAIGVNYKLGR